MRWSKGANGGGLESEEIIKKYRQNEEKEEFALAENREYEAEAEDEAPRNKVDQNSSMPTSHYLLCQLCRLTCKRRLNRHGVMKLDPLQSLRNEKLNVTN